MADVPGDGRGFALTIGLMWLLFVIFMLGGLVFLGTQIGNDLIDTAQAWARSFRQGSGSSSPAPSGLEAIRALAKLAGLDF